MNQAGNAFAQAQASLRKAMGPGAFGYEGRKFDCTSRPLDSSKRGGLIPDGSGNADSTDEREITLNPSDFPNAQASRSAPIEGETCSYQGRPYLIKKVNAFEMSYGVPVALPIIVYRAPQPDTATTAPAGETNPGTRKTYYPPAQE